MRLQQSGILKGWVCMNVYNMYMSVEFLGHSHRNLVKLLLMKNERRCIAVFLKTNVFAVYMGRECDRNLDLRVQVQIVLEASKSAGAK